MLNEQRYLPIVNILDKETYSYGDMSFGVIPKINAISRMDHMTNVNILVKYFMDLDHDNRDTALQIEKINNLRKDLSTAMCEKGLKMIKENNTINVIYDNEFYENDVARAYKRWQEELKRTADKNMWMKQFLDSLDNI